MVRISPKNIWLELYGVKLIITSSTLLILIGVPAPSNKIYEVTAPAFISSLTAKKKRHAFSLSLMQ
jgi:hypothetical protein